MITAPPPKRKWFNRPSRELSASRIKSDSFSTKPPSVRPLHRSTWLSTSPVSPTSDTTVDDTKTKPKLFPALKSMTPSTSSAVSSRGTFTTQSYGIKKNKKLQKFGCKMCDKVCNSIKELTKHHQQSHNILYCKTCSKAFDNPASLA